MSYAHPIAHMAWSAYVDYLRLTHDNQDNDVDLEMKYHMAMLRCARRAGEEDMAPERWRMLGYYGWKCGKAFWGASAQGYMIQCAGVGAAELFDMDLPYTNVPRIDVQATYWYATYFSGVAATVAELSNASRSKTRGRRWKIRHINGMGNGDTCYIGSRGKKSKFLRCYDKWRETDEDEQYAYAWRYEAELSDGHARYAYNTIKSLGQSDLSCLMLLSGYWQERGISLPYDGKLDAIPAHRLPTDVTSKERWLAWLENGVGTSIAKWLARGASREEVMKALGLDCSDT